MQVAWTVPVASHSFCTGVHCVKVTMMHIMKKTAWRMIVPTHSFLKMSDAAAAEQC